MSLKKISMDALEPTAPAPRSIVLSTYTWVDPN